MKKPKRTYLILILVLTALFLAGYVLMANYTLKLLFETKVWPHKVNDVERLERAGKAFPGVELDLVFEKASRNFDVNHPPDMSSGLSLTAYFNSQKTNKNLNYWLDLKNLDHENDSLALAVLDSITSLYQIPRHHIIVESGSPQYLTGFFKKGFKTAYYLPSGISSINNKDAEVILKNIEENIHQYTPTYISFEYREYRLFKEKLPNTKKIAWFDVYGSMNKINARLLLFDLLRDDEVEILLIPFD